MHLEMNCSGAYVVHINRDMDKLEGVVGRSCDRDRQCIELMNSIQNCRARILEREQMGLPVSQELTLLRSDLLRQFKSLECEIKYLNRPNLE